MKNKHQSFDDDDGKLMVLINSINSYGKSAEIFLQPFISFSAAELSSAFCSSLGYRFFNIRNRKHLAQ